VRAEHAPEERLVAPNLWATLSVHVVASPASHAALEVGGLSVHSFLGCKFRGGGINKDAEGGGDDTQCTKVMT